MDHDQNDLRMVHIMQCIASGLFEEQKTQYFLKLNKCSHH